MSDVKPKGTYKDSMQIIHRILSFRPEGAEVVQWITKTLEIKKSNFYRMKNGEIPPSLKLITQASQKLCVPVAILYGGLESPSQVVDLVDASPSQISHFPETDMETTEGVMVAMSEEPDPDDLLIIRYLDHMRFEFVIRRLWAFSKEVISETGSIDLEEFQEFTGLTRSKIVDCIRSAQPDEHITHGRLQDIIERHRIPSDGASYLYSGKDRPPFGLIDRMRAAMRKRGGGEPEDEQCRSFSNDGWFKKIDRRNGLYDHMEQFFLGDRVPASPIFMR